MIIRIFHLDQGLLWSLLALTSNLGAVISTSLVYYIQSIPKVFTTLAKFGMACIVVFYVFFPQTSHSKSTNTKQSDTSVEQTSIRELFCLFLSFIAQFLVYLLFVSHIDLPYSSNHLRMVFYLHATSLPKSPLSSRLPSLHIIQISLRLLELSLYCSLVCSSSSSNC